MRLRKQTALVTKIPPGAAAVKVVNRGRLEADVHVVFLDGNRKPLPSAEKMDRLKEDQAA